MSEIIIEEVERLFRSFSFTSELGNAVEVALREEVTSAMALVMADASTQQRIKQTVEAAVQKGIDNVAATISKRVESTLTGSRSYP